MKRKKIGKKFLIVGVLILIVSMLLFFRAEASPFTLVLFGVSILINTIQGFMHNWASTLPLSTFLVYSSL